MQIIDKPINKIIPYDKNPRNNDAAVNTAVNKNTNRGDQTMSGNYKVDGLIVYDNGEFRDFTADELQELRELNNGNGIKDIKDVIIAR